MYRIMVLTNVYFTMLGNHRNITLFNVSIHISNAHVLFVDSSNNHNLTFPKFVEARYDARLHLMLQSQQIIYLLITFTWISIGQVVGNGFSKFFLNAMTKAFVAKSLSVIYVDH